VIDPITPDEERKRLQQQYTRGKYTIHTCKTLIAMEKVALVAMSERFVQAQSLYTYTNPEYLTSTRACAWSETNLFKSRGWEKRCAQLGQSHLPWEWDPRFNYGPNKHSSKEAHTLLSELASYGFACSTIFKSDYLDAPHTTNNTILRMFYRIGEGCLTVAYEVPNSKANEIEQIVTNMHGTATSTPQLSPNQLQRGQEKFIDQSEHGTGDVTPMR